MANIRRPRKGSLQFWHRARAKKETPLVKNWPKSKNVNLLGFVGYKAGMTHVMLKDNRAGSTTKGDSISWPVTVVECPAVKIFSIRFYSKDNYGEQLVSEVFNPKLDKELARVISLPKNYNYEEKLKKAEERLGIVTDITINVYTQPRKSGLGKKTPEILEMAIGGEDIKAKLDFAKANLDKEMRVSDVLKAGLKVDVHAVTKGKGFQGLIKRFGIALRSHKAEKGQRRILYGPLRPARIIWGQHMPGKMGYHTRTEYNKGIVFIGDKAEKINPKGGFLHYGLVKSDYVLLHGSVPGPAKRLIRIVESIRGSKPIGNIELQHVSQESKQ